jgi:Right handed beta helix region/Disaggregatase related
MTSHHKLFIFLLLGLFLAACSQQALPNHELDELGVIGTTYYVAINGNDSNDGTSSRPWKTISYAVSAASPVQPSDQIIVRTGLYQEEVELGKSGSAGNYIRLIAQPGVTLRYRGAGGNFQNGILESLGKSYWLIRGFRVEGLAPSTPDSVAPPIWGGIVLKDASNMIVRNNFTYRTGSSGIIVMYGGPLGATDPQGEIEVSSKNIKILYNTIDNANNWLDQEALSMWGVDGFEVAYNKVQNSKTEGIDTKVGSRNGSIHGNTVTNVAVWSGRGRNGGPAIYVEASRANLYNIDVYNNVVYNNNADGIFVSAEVPSLGESRDVRIYNNIVYSNGILGVNGGTCLGFSGRVRNSQAYHNTCYKNIYGFVVEQAYGNYLPQNIILRNNIFANTTYLNGRIGGTGTTVRLENNLITNSVADLYELAGGSPSVTLVGNIRANSAGFVNAGANDFHLTASSAAKDKGSSTVGKATTDFDGVARPQGTKPDLGAFEYQ